MESVEFDSEAGMFAAYVTRRVGSGGQAGAGHRVERSAGKITTFVVCSRGHLH